MIPRECKRLAEVDFPIAAVSKHAVREKSIRHGHPSTLHLWWARRPLASCRAMLLALLLPDPCDEHCPAEFKDRAREALGQLQRAGPSDDDLRRGLLRFIGDFANWDHAAHPRFLEVGRGLVRAAYPDDPPLVVDPFAGGGAIPLEALRLGCEAFASDLNSVASLILKVLLEDVPHRGPELADELRKLGKEVKQAAERELAELYPLDSDGARPIAYLWTRTVRCEAPDCGAEIPLVRSMWLSKKASRRRALRITNRGRKGVTPEFEIFEPERESDVQRGTVSRAKATCQACNIVLGPERVRAQLSEQRGGADVIFDGGGDRIGGARLLAVVTLKPGESGRRYRLPVAGDYQAVRAASRRLADMESTRAPSELSLVPDEPTPAGGGSGAGRAFSIQKYGMMTFGDLFTARQKLALATIARHINCAAGGHQAEARRLAALALGKTADLGSAGTPWKPDAECPVHMLSSQKIPPFWDWAEAVLTADASGSFESAYERSVATLAGALSFAYEAGATMLADAAARGPLPHDSAEVWFTDPPYYDAIPYADLADFFFVWLRRALPDDVLLADPFDAANRLTPKGAEIVQDETKRLDEGRVKDRTFFESAMAKAFAEGRLILSDEGIASVIFAHKTTEGWEALLSGIITARWTITGSWPIATEMRTRLRARDSAALATSVHLVCRPRPDDAPVGDWADVLRELPIRVGSWMERLQSEGVHGADLVFACVGPALEIYSRYERVETADGQEVPLAEYLEKVWEVVGRAALRQVLGQEDGAGALEEDSRLVALFLWTLQSTAGMNGSANAKNDVEAEEEDPGEDAGEDDEGGSRARKPKGYTLVHDVVRRFAQPLGIHLEDWERRIIETKKGTVRLLPIQERATQLFGEDGTQAAADQLEAPAASPQLSLFPEMQVEPRPRRGRRRVVVTAGDDAIAERRGATTLDRVHAAMLLQASGRANALRALLGSEIERGPEFLRLANSLSALYPRGSEEKRLLDAMLLAVPR